jgi:pimeloyl-ACP methyl ester carboxylesterase
MKAGFSRRLALGLFSSAPILMFERSRAASPGIDESRFVSIGSIDQWISIQGRSIANPALLYLHGGPAEAQSPFLKEFIPWQSDFTVVNWDQRGAGKTFGRNGSSTPGMSAPETALDRLCQDVRETAEYACRRLGKEKVVLVGQSWGTMLGLQAIKRWPHLFHAFVGTGHFVSWAESLAGQAKWTRQQAVAANDQAALGALDETAHLPETDMKRIVAANKYRWAPSDLEYLKLQQAFVGPPPLPERGDVADWLGGSGFSLPRLLPVAFSWDARKLGLDIPVPFFVIQGRDDHVTPFEVAERYTAEIRAPAKKFIPIAGGHFACFTSSREFVSALRQYAYPLAMAKR